MKRPLALLCLLLSLFSTPVAPGATCSGTADCRACSTYASCGHCAQEGGSCGVRERLQAASGQPVLVAQTTQAVAAPVPKSMPSDRTSTSSPSSARPTVEPVPPLVQPTSTVRPAESLVTCVKAIAAQSDPAKLATLGSRQANPRLKRILYYLAAARDRGADPAAVIDDAQVTNGSAGTPRAPLVKASLLRNLKICDGLVMLTPEDRERLKRGLAPTVHREGNYKGQVAEVDHIVPLAQANELGNELANLEMLPATLNRAKSDKIGERQLDYAKKFRAAGLISEASMARVEAKFVPSGTGKYELQEQ